ncbi:MAG: hypothetical protein DRJ42_16650 [Deltaproteobacteria bacterium]|nr:MAG: hypothetical protein DRJ42_16650 [Deltaproteobacteria bacterium]
MKHVVVGLVLVVIGLWGVVTWWETFGFVMRGVIPVAVLGLGLVATLSGYYRLNRRNDYYEDEPVPEPTRRRRRG